VTVQGFLFTTLPTNDLGLLARSLPIGHELAQRGHRVAFCSPAPAPSTMIAEAGFENILPRHPLYQFMAVTPGLPGFLAAVRSGPGTGYPKVGALKQGDEVTVTGRNKAGTWLAITTADGTEGWAYAEYIRVDTAVESLPVAQAPPPLASPTPSGPKPTLSVDEQIAKVAGGEHGTLPQLKGL
jgi:hypothetical protein